MAARKLGDEMIIMSAVDSTLFSLNEVATVIWLAANGSTPLSKIVQDRILLEFDIDPQQAYAEALEFVEQLARHGILIIGDQPILAARAAGASSL